MSSTNLSRAGEQAVSQRRQTSESTFKSASSTSRGTSSSRLQFPRELTCVWQQLIRSLSCPLELTGTVRARPACSGGETSASSPETSRTQ